MYQVVSNREIAPCVVRMEISAPLIARKRKPGQFVVVRASEESERVPFTLVDSDPEKGTITLIIQTVGFSSREIASTQEGEALSDVVGPLGRPTHIGQIGTVVSIGGGVGTAVAYPIARAMKDAGNRVIGIVGARSKDLIILENEMRQFCDEVIVCTDDGSYGRHGFVTDALKDLIGSGTGIDHVLAVGPVIMMKVVCDVTREHGIPTTVSLNPIMVDGTGMCGGCRVEVGGETKFACVDGPEFDGHKVNFDVLIKRLSTYRELEQQAEHECKLGR